MFYRNSLHGISKILMILLAISHAHAGSDDEKPHQQKGKSFPSSPKVEKAVGQCEGESTDLMGVSQLADTTRKIDQTLGGAAATAPPSAACASVPPQPEIEGPEIREARALKKAHSQLTPIEIAKRVKITEGQKALIQWMKKDLELYDQNFDDYFEQKLRRATPRSFRNAEDFVHQFVGPERGKIIKTPPSASEIGALNAGGQLYVDTWAVPFFNSAIQNKASAHQNLKHAIETFTAAEHDLSTLSLYDLSKLMPLFARPEFDDVRRYKLQLFPTPQETERFSKERSDAKFVGDHFPSEAFLPTNKSLALNTLSFSFGKGIHYFGLLSHGGTAQADGRLFVSPSDFLEHDQSHGFFTIVLPPPGNVIDWTRIHDRFRSIQAQTSDPKQRFMNTVVYFYFTHESGYKSMIPDRDGAAPSKDAYKKELHVIKERVNTFRDLDWVKQPEKGGEHWEVLLDESFRVISKFFKQEIKNLTERRE